MILSMNYNVSGWEKHSLWPAFVGATRSPYPTDI